MFLLYLSFSTELQIPCGFFHLQFVEKDFCSKCPLYENEAYLVVVCLDSRFLRFPFLGPSPVESFWSRMEKNTRSCNPFSCIYRKSLEHFFHKRKDLLSIWKDNSGLKYWFLFISTSRSILCFTSII